MTDQIKKSGTSNSAFTLLLFVSLLLTFLTVVLSAYIRLSVAGVGCDQWPECYGVVLAHPDQRGVAVLTEAGAEMPHAFARTAHRLIASVLGVLVAGVALIAWRQRKTSDTGLILPMLLLGLTIFLSLLGYLTPSPLVPMVTAANITGGMAMLAILWWLGQRSVIKISAGSNETGGRTRRLAIAALLLVSVQICLGSWTSANYAAAACPELLDCGDDWSAADLAQGFNPARQLNTDIHHKVVQTGVMSAIQVSHRAMAVILFLYLTWLAITLIKEHPPLRANAITIALFSVLQMLAGVLSIWMHGPLLLVTFHNTLAALLLLSVVNLIHQLTPTQP
ncbi:MAG: COX15/CtaA family protein [Gammaproteobacteria bacterium]|nr:COX15/CtaA family protein [Gammaproteobacteria bacterium]